MACHPWFLRPIAEDCYYRWCIIETEAYAECENRGATLICHEDARNKTCGKIFAEGGNGLIITCNSDAVYDNVLIRGVLTIFYSQPYKCMRSSVLGFERHLSTPVDLTLPKDEATLYIQQGKFTCEESPIASLRVGMKGKSDNPWNFKLFMLNDNTKTIDTALLKNLNQK